MSTIAETILSVSNSLFSMRNKLNQARQQRKKEVADFIASIAECIENVSASLKQNIYPHGSCEEIFQYSNKMEAAIGDLVGQSSAEKLATQLKEVWEIEQLYDELRSDAPPEQVRKLSVLDQAAGLFRATAAFVRVSP